jgi:transcriptional regulator with XRE-family HTH domain
MMFDTKAWGASLNRLRKDRDMTQSELADILNVTRQAVSKYENGDSFPDISILIVIAETFSVSFDVLINAGNPTVVEKKLLTQAALNKQSNVSEGDYLNDHILKDIINIAPLLRASTLDRIVGGFQHYDIDISDIVQLSEYINDKTLQNLIDNASFHNLDPEMLKRFIPFLDDDSKMKIFDRVLTGELDFSIMKLLKPYINLSLIENAVVCGVLDEKILKE